MYAYLTPIIYCVYTNGDLFPCLYLLYNPIYRAISLFYLINSIQFILSSLSLNVNMVSEGYICSSLFRPYQAATTPCQITTTQPPTIKPPSYIAIIKATKHPPTTHLHHIRLNTNQTYRCKSILPFVHPHTTLNLRKTPYHNLPSHKND